MNMVGAGGSAAGGVEAQASGGQDAAAQGAAQFCRMKVGESPSCQSGIDVGQQAIRWRFVASRKPRPASTARKRSEWAHLQTVFRGSSSSPELVAP